MTPEQIQVRDILTYRVGVRSHSATRVHRS